MGRFVCVRTFCTQVTSSIRPKAMSACVRVSTDSSYLAAKTRSSKVDSAVEPGTMYCSGSIARNWAISSPSAFDFHAKQ